MKNSIEEKLQQAESLFELISVIGSQHDYSEIFRIITTKISSLFNSDLISISMINPITLSTIKTMEKIGHDNSKSKYDIVKTNNLSSVMIC